MKLILINGPPRSGKDTAGAFLSTLLGAHIGKFAKVLKEAAHALYGMPNLPHDAFEDRKDKPCPEFFGKTPREIYIALSETYFKPLHGEDIFGQLLLKDLLNEESQFDFEGPVTVTDSGFVPEAMVLINHFGPENCCLLRMWRPGYDYSGDSRGYIDLPIKTDDLKIDDGDIPGMHEALTQLFPNQEEN